MNEYKINFTANTITISKRFAVAASDPTSVECEKLSKLQAAYPSMRIVHKTHRSPSKANANKGLTYDRMERYINLHENAVELLDNYKAVKVIAATQKSPYKFMRNWFMQQFPDYGKFPDIGRNGKIVSIPPVAAPATTEKDGDTESNTAAQCGIDFTKGQLDKQASGF